VGLAVGKEGELFVLMSESFRGGTDMRVLDRNGKYLRTIIPYGVDTPKERMAAVACWSRGRTPAAGAQRHGAHQLPADHGLHHQTMAVHPKGPIVMVSAVARCASRARRATSSPCIRRAEVRRT